MDAKIIGTKVEKVEITVTPEDLIDSLAEAFGLAGVLEPDYLTRCELKDDTIVKYKDVSYHGSPDWEAVETINDPVKVSAYKNLVELKSLARGL